ncbi:hypothetical protein AB0D40_31290 [Streptomyces massasporeus]|uniref:hypothetical protein n=1 Tax=Streptomyces massasporeus TaxID=67324 RepID=UPI00340D5894
MPETSAPATGLASQYITRVSGDLESNIKEQERVGAEIAVLQERLATLQHDHGVLLTMQQALGVSAPPAKPETRSETGTSARVVSPRRKKTSTTTGAKPKAGASAATEPRTGLTAATKAKTDAAAEAPKPKTNTATDGAQPKAGRPGVPPVRTAGGKSASGAPGGKSASRAAAGKSASRAAAGKSASGAPGGKSASGAAGGAKASQPTLVELIRRHLAEQKEPRSAAEISAALGQARPGRAVSPKVVRITLEGLVARGQAERSKQGRSVFYVATAPRPAAAPEAEAQPEAADH